MILPTQNTLQAYRNQTQSKDLPVCDEILSTVENFKTFLNEQKKIREELVNLSQQPLVTLKEELNSMLQQASTVISGLRRISVQKDRLKEDLLKEEKNVGLAQRGCESGGHLENSGISQYFASKLLEFETRLKTYKQEMEVLEGNISTHGRCLLSPRDFMILLRQIDNEFICLAAHLQTLCEEVKALKTRYLRILRTSGGDVRNPFAEVEASCAKSQMLCGSDGPSLGMQKDAVIRSNYGPSPFLSTTLNNVTVIQPTAIPGVQQQHLSFGSLTTPAAMTGLPTTPSLTGQTGFLTAPTSIGFPLSSTTATQGLSNSLKPFSFGAISTVNQQPAFNSTLPSTGFGLSANSLSTTKTGENIFGKRLATKPASLMFGKP